jgi:hypothetical protein
LTKIADAMPPTIAKARQPSTVNGSPETLIEKGVREGARITSKMVNEIIEAAAGKSDTRAMVDAIDRAAEDMDIQPLARAIERRTLQGLMLGALDAQYEDESGEQVEPVKFERRVTLQGDDDDEEADRIAREREAKAEEEREVQEALRREAFDIKEGEEGREPTEQDLRETEVGGEPEPDPNFVDRPLQSAINHFRKRKPVNRQTWERMNADSKRRSFTVAGQTNEDIVDKIKAALEEFVRTGQEQDKWIEYAQTKLMEAGFLPVNPSHIETIFRTNVMSAHNSGRLARANQPIIRRLRPYWQVRTVRDDRQRIAHGEADGVKGKFVLPADDPWWSTAYPPFGFNCRCRVITMSEGDVEARGLRIASGADMPADLPDPGFVSGTSIML